MKHAYQGSSILITGTTGFLGKVLLEKILYSLPQVARIYVLIRAKKGSLINERFKKEIVSSPCFDRLRSLHQHLFDQFIQNKVYPIEGDLLKQKIGLSESNRRQIIQNCNVIINCAASIDFNARLDQAIDSNIRGTMRMLQLASQLNNLKIFTHVSTCYVNCNQKGLVKQQILLQDSDPEKQLKELLSMPLKELVANSKRLIGKYPNTYTFTKSLCERLIQKKRMNIPVCIIRPAIINTSYAQPFPGWLDSIAAAAALYLFAGLGFIKQIVGSPQFIGDTVPVDIVVANIIVATAYNMNKNVLKIYHVGSSDRNPMTWKQIQLIVTNYWNTNESQSKFAKSSVLFSENKLMLNIHRLVQRMPTWMYSKMAPYMGKQYEKNAQRMNKSIERGNQIVRIFTFFTSNQWIYETRRVQQLIDYLTTDERKKFLVDVADIDMRYFILLNSYGLQKYILKENIEIPSPQNANLLHIREKQTYFSDIKWAMTAGVTQKKNKSFKSRLLVSTRVLAAIQEEAASRTENSMRQIEYQKQIVHKQATKIIEELVGEIRMPVVRFLVWTLHKIFKKIYEKVNVNMEMFEQLKQIQKMNIPLIFLPTHRSYLDFLILGYILFAYKLKMPYIVSDQALKNAALLPFLIRSSGAFFFRKKKYKQSRLYKVIFNKYVEMLLHEGNNFQFFIEGTRSRSGKISTPQHEVLEVIVDSIMNGKLADAYLVPLTINYQKVLEGDTFPSELLGQDRLQESLLRIVKAIPLLNVNFGRVYIEICDPISVKKFQEKFYQQKQIISSKKYQFQRQRITESLGLQVIYKLNQKSVIMSTGLVSAVLLMYRRGLSEDMLIKTVNWLARFIIRKGFKVGGVNQNSAAIAVRNSINHLDQILTKTKKSIFEIQISAANQFPKILMLSYYRNTIIHTFFPQAFIGYALAAFGTQLNRKEGVSKNRLHQKTLFLMDLLQQEYILPHSLQSNQDFQSTLIRMVRGQMIEIKKSELVIIAAQNQLMVSFHCSLLKSLIECYWACLVYLDSISRSEDQIQQASSVEKFYDMVQWFVESLYDEKVIEHYQACSLETIKNAFKTYEKMEFIKVTVSKKQYKVEILTNSESLQNMQTNINFFIQNLSQSISLSPIDIARGFVKTDLSKL